MFSYIWPIALLVASNIIYHICAKSIPEEANAFVTLTVSYLIGAVCCAVAAIASTGGANFVKDLGKLNWAPYVLGIVIVGLEAGFIYAYKAGWQVSTAAIVQSSFLSTALIAVGALIYHEPITWNKLVGVVICLIGLVFINLK